MTTNQHNDISTIIAEILGTLGYSEGNPPHHITDKQAAIALGVKPSTLAVWRSTGRYNLPYVKVGRLVRYRIRDLAIFLLNHAMTHTS
ncbi:helix-turn-helix domain-containing protein [Dickeya chrysanthemi]|uniref:helix-turn-helix domain-containing protein n=1 Tax=Dickeya chrysanthemi TaxID=556 RepID=UPI0003A3DC5E|nr:helix-turn-helix domain-containing protein [Dickeya chrysanthemi]